MLLSIAKSYEFDICIFLKVGWPSYPVRRLSRPLLCTVACLSLITMLRHASELDKTAEKGKISVTGWGQIKFTILATPPFFSCNK